MAKIMRYVKALGERRKRRREIISQRKPVSRKGIKSAKIGVKAAQRRQISNGENGGGGYGVCWQLA
jgi:hypothetical protein